MARLETWVSQGGRLRRPGKPTRGNAQTATATATVQTYFTGGTPVRPLPFPTYTDRPLVQWETLDPSYSLRNLNVEAEKPDVGAIIRSKLTSAAYVQIPDGFKGKLGNFNSGGTPYSAYIPTNVGIWHDGPPEDAEVRITPMVSTVGSLVPPQTNGDANGDGTSNPYHLMRQGPSNSNVTVPLHNYGWWLKGTDQMNGPNGQPHNYSGLIDYMSGGSTQDWMKFSGIPGDWNSPPGETFALSIYRTKVGGSKIRFCEVDGYNELGRKVGGGVGTNGALNVVYEDCFFHDFYVSGGPIYSGAGGPNGTMCTNATVTRVKAWNNANHTYPNPGGKTFSSFNCEGLIGTVVVDHPDWRMLNMETLQVPYVTIGNTQSDCPDFTIIEPNWHPELGTVTKGAFWIQIKETYAGVANKQTTWPVVIKNGVSLQPVLRGVTAGWPTVNPATQYIIKRG